MKQRLIQSILFGFLLTLSIPALCNEWDAMLPKGQPFQKKSKVMYKPGLKNKFFDSEQWSYPWWVVQHEDGLIENTMGGPTDEKDLPRLKHTASCFTSHQYEHEIKFADAQLLDDGTIVLYIHDESASTYDNLLIKVKDGLFSSQYWTTYPSPAGHDKLVWITQKQALTLDKKTYKKGDTIKGKITFECVQKSRDPKFADEPGRKIKIVGVFKTVLE